MEHAEHARTDLPKRMKRFTVAVTGTPADGHTTVAHTENEPFGNGTQVEILVDPTEFLDYVSLADVLEYDKEHGLLEDAEESERRELMNRLEAVDFYDVQDLLNELFDAIQDGRKADALDAIDRFGAPKWASDAEAKEAYDAAMCAN